MKKVKLSEEKKVVLQLVFGFLCCVACIFVYFALEKPETKKQASCYCENKNADLTENNVKEKAVLVLAGNQDPVVELPDRISLGEFKLTAYCSCKKCCGSWANGRPIDEYGNDIVIGASGERLCQGVSVAVDPAVIPYDNKVYIDGKEGTTGLQIYDRLAARQDIDLLLIDEDKRKDPAERKRLMDAADIVFLCLPDAAATERIFETLLGDDLPARKAFIAENGSRYRKDADI